MCLLGHPVVFTQALVNEKSLYDDGLFQRILMSAGAPPQTKARDIRNAPKSRMALHSIFLLISIINKTTRNFTFSNAATVLFDEQFDLYKDFVTTANISDSYLG